MEAAIPAAYRPRLFRGRLWPDKKRDAYDKMIRNQPKRHPASRRREDPISVAFPHRLQFAYSPDDGPALDAQHLRLVCDGERLSDWAGDDGRLLGGSTTRTEFQTLVRELAHVWLMVSGAIKREEHVSAPATANLRALVLQFFERRYGRFARVLPAGRVREEILANTARQYGELRTYFVAFDTSLTECAAWLDYPKQARYVNTRLHALFAPVVTHILAPDDAGTDAGLVPYAGGCGGSAGTSAASSPVDKSPRSILKAQPAGVTFADGASLAAYSPAAPPQPSPPAVAPTPVAAPTPAAPGFPFFYPQQMMFADAVGSAPAARPPYYPPFAGAPWWGGFGPYPPAPAAATAPAIKAEPGQPRDKDRKGKKGKGEHLGFLSQPMHAYVSGSDVAVVPAGSNWQPVCGCRNSHGFPGFNPGPHATWDCPFRYIQQCGFCPGFNSDGTKDPAQWMPGGDVLTRATKDKWLELIERHDLPLPRDAGARAPDFHK